MKVLFVNGIGFHETKTRLLRWVPGWIGAINTAAYRFGGATVDLLDPFGPDGKPSGLGGDYTRDHGVLYHENVIGKHEAPGTLDYFRVVSSLIASAVTSTVGDVFQRDCALFAVPEELKWKAR